MIEASCHCGALRIEVDAPPPETVTDCNCSNCRKRGLLWAYYSPKQVRLIPPAGATSIYMWGDKVLELHTCKICGCTTHWSPVDKAYDRMGVNARLMEPKVLAAARVRKLDGADTWTYLDGT
jgi:hypothetical protein